MDIYNQITILMEKRMINHEHFSWKFSDTHVLLDALVV